MRKRLRTALVYLLMLALPMQAMAAFSMQLCQQVHGTPDHAAQPAAMRHGDDVKPGMHHPAKATSCSLCTFCVGAVVIDQSSVQAAQAHRSEPLQLLSERMISVVPDTPERPPRLSFS